jgi:two-component system response regulator HydG/two-component system response regulator AtoC
MDKNLLIIDDEINSLKVLSRALGTEGYKIYTAVSAEEGLTMLGKIPCHLILCDYKLPGMDGEKLLEKVKTNFPEIPFLLLTAFGTIEYAVKAMKKGAYSYLTKPINTNILITVIKEALKNQKRNLDKDPDTRNEFLNIIGKSKAMQEVFSIIRRVSKTDASVLILGESGAGKELVARAIHYTSLRCDKPFIPIDCTAIPTELMESELFGFNKGAFTCAYENKIGLLEVAQKGTVFFDEIGDLDFSLQKKILRFLQEKEFYRIGGKNKIQVDVRILAATNKNIEDAVEKKEFRDDLYYRLNVITIHVPPLKDRKEDIPLFADHFLDVFSKKNKKQIFGFDPNVMEILLEYDWPGNVRELENIIQRAVILCPYEQINFQCLPRKLKITNEKEWPDQEEEFNLTEIEKRIVRKALDKTSWNQSQTAKLLGISRKQLMTKLKNLGLNQKTMENSEEQ